MAKLLIIRKLLSILAKPLLKRLISIVLVIVGIAVILTAAFFYFKKSTTSIPTIAVTKGSIAEQAEAVGYIKTRNFSTIKSQVDGIVEAIYHEEGEYVAKNTPLIKIRPAPAPVEYAEAYKNLISDIAEEKHAQTNFNRYQYLLQSRVITGNDHQYIEARKEHNTAKAQRVLSEQKLALLTRGETVVGGKVIASTVGSPIDGYILYRNVNVGDPVISISSAQAATALFIIANMQEMVFHGVVDERDAAKVKIGTLAKIKVGSLPDKEIIGVVSRIALQSDKENILSGSSQGSGGSSSGSISNSSSPFNVGFRIEITNLQLPKGLVLRSGYSATANIELKKVENTLLLPMRVIQFKDTKPYVLLPAGKNKKPKEQPIELGISDSINVEIKSGLKFDDKVIDQPDATVTTQDK